jgi:LAO/AO transport system kinase
MGKDVIIIETVGVGQDEVEIVKSAHTTVIVVIPGMGDDIQAIKAGILEVGDIFVVNKSERDGADRTMNDLNVMIEMGNDSHVQGVWKPVVLKAQAVNDLGVSELIEEISRHSQHLKNAGESLNLRCKRERVQEELAEMVKGRLIQDVFKRLIESGEFERAVESIVQGESNPYAAVDDLILREPILAVMKDKAK